MHEALKAKISPQNSKKGPFIKALKKPIANQNQEKAADSFAQKVGQSAAIKNAYSTSPGFKFNKNIQAKPEKKEPVGSPLPQGLITAFKTHFGEDFAHVRIHTDGIATKLAQQYNAAALTMGHHIFINSHVYKPATPQGLQLLAHELYHTIAPNNNDNSPLEVKLKPIADLQDQSPLQKNALQRAVKIAVGEQGKVNAAQTNEDKTRVGWPFLLEYFKTTMGADTIVADKKDYKSGKFLEENIKFVKKGAATKIKIIDGVHTPIVEDKVDLLPSWCGIFAFWAYHKGGIHPQPWTLGKPNFTAKDQYRKGEYLPRPGDLVIKNGYNHHAMVVKTSPENITDTKELANVKVTTINGNTAGSNHTGGQIQLKEDPYSYWDYYVKPFFAGVKIDSEADYKLDERLKESLGNPTEQGIKASGKTTNNDSAALKVNSYETGMSKVDLGLETDKKEENKKTDEPAEAPKIDPKEILAKDKEFKTLNQKLDKNAEEKKTHDTPENKAAQAQSSAVSPVTESLGKAKANKVEKLGLLPAPPPFRAIDLKNSILNEVKKLIQEKKDEANATGNKPKIKDAEIREVKETNNKEIKAKKTETIGDVEKTHNLPPDESAVEKRQSVDVVLEDPGKQTHIPNTDRAVAKPLADERITLEADSAKIDTKMADNEVDEQQLADSEETKFTTALGEKQGSQAQASTIKDDYRNIEEEKLTKDKSIAQSTIGKKVEQIQEARQGQFGQVDTVKDKTKTADELKREEVTNGIEKIYSESEKSVNAKLEKLEKTVSDDFDAIMSTANENFKKEVNNALDDEFSWEWAAKKLNRSDYNYRVGKVFKTESEKYTKALDLALDPLTNRIADTLNAIMSEIQEAKKAVKVFVEKQPLDMQEIAVVAAKGVLEKFSSLETAVNEKQEALTNNLAKKYADGVMALEDEFKKIMDSRKSWLEKALDAIVDAIKEIIKLFSDLKKALERAVDYAKRIIKAPLKFFKNLVKGATLGFENFLKNIGKHLLQGALEWITGQMGDAGITLPEKFDFKGILSLILQVLGVSMQNVMAIARKVIGEKYVALLEKGADLGVKVGDKILKIFTIIKNEGLAGLWEFIKEQFTDLKERLLEEAKGFIVTTIIETAIPKILSMLIPGAGFISAVKSLIDFLLTLFAKARQIVNIITGIIDTFGEILAGNIGKVASMVEGVLAKFVGLAITFLAAILGIGKIGKKISDLINKKIKEPINKAITKVMEKLKALMTKLGIFKFLDMASDKIKKGAKFIDDKKEKVKSFFKAVVNYIKNKFKKQYAEKDGSQHTLQFNDNMELERHSVTRDLGNHLLALDQWVGVDGGFKKKEVDTYQPKLKSSKSEHSEIRKIIGEAVKQASDGKFEGADKYFSKAEGTKLNTHLSKIASNLREVPTIGKKTLAKIPVTIISYPAQTAGGDGQMAEAPLISIDSQFIGSKADAARKDSELTKKLKKAISTYRGGGFNLVKGHLINHELHGSGATTSNLGPIPTSGNNEMLNTFEGPSKKIVHEGGVISYKVEYIYGPAKIDIDALRKKLNYATNNKKNAQLIADLAALGNIPTKVKYEIERKFYHGKDDDKQDKINDPINWKGQLPKEPGPGEEKFKLKKSFEFNHNDFF